MEYLINKLINMGMEQYMDTARDELTISDKVYLKDVSDEMELEKRYKELDLTQKQRFIVNDYIACITTTDSRYSDISYMAGIKDTVKMLVYLELITDINNIE